MRIECLRNELSKGDMDGYLITDAKNVYYLTGFMDLSEATSKLIVPIDGEPVLLVQQLNYDLAKEKTKKCFVKGISQGEKIVDKLIREISILNMKNLYFDTLPISIYLKLVEKIKEGNIKLNQEIIRRLRRVKSKREITFISKATKLADVAIEAGIEVIKPGIKEYEIAAEMEYAMRMHGSEGIAFETIVASGPMSAYPHGVCSSREVRKGDFIVMDLGAICSGYRSDLTRTIVLGTPSKKQSQMLNLVLTAQHKALQYVREGLKAKDVDAIARETFTSKGYDRYFIHGLGHGVGLDIHEPPTISPVSEDILEEGNVVTIEPGIYIKGFGGVRIEDTILIHKDRGERLTRAPSYL